LGPYAAFCKLLSTGLTTLMAKLLSKTQNEGHHYTSRQGLGKNQLGMTSLLFWSLVNSP
jgi:hypothetical protein